ncbi:hypothetical protein OUZ56_029997 [Daphnia magna]|uniref:Uncharacterized protein n=1 Tax=Daphnia magna TaxID=35525 RepID=A0ABR0B8F9_9CRUS|nr:hypothetical protein OUZ56_029997 [Daphnia magna]
MDCLDLMVRSVCVHQLLGPHTRHWIFPVRFDVTKDLPQHKPTECRKAVKRIEAAWDVVADGGVVREGAAEPQQHCKEQLLHSPNRPAPCGQNWTIVVSFFFRFAVKIPQQLMDKLMNKRFYLVTLSCIPLDTALCAGQS